MSGGSFRRISLGLVTAVVVAVVPIALPAEPAVAGTGAESFVSMISTSGDWVGGGTNRFYHPGNAQITVSGSAAYVDVRVSGGNLGDYFNLEFAAPPGQTLVEGVYERAERAAFREAGRPGIDVSGDGRGCNEISGRFEVKRLQKDAAGAVESLWVVYEQHCEGGTSALFGEVRVNVPGDGGALVVGPRQVRWPDTDQNAPVTDAPVVVVNPTSAPVTVSAPTIEGPNAGAFSITANECTGALAPGDACIVWVDFSATTGGQNSATLRIPEGGVVHEVGLGAWVLTGTTRFTMISEQGDYIGQGETNRYTPANASIAVGGSRQFVGAWIEGRDGSWWHAEFSPPEGEILAAGRTYTGARRAAFSGPAAGIDVGGSGRGCNEIFGEFTVRAIDVSAGGELEEVAIDYEQHCERPDAPALTGVLEFRLGGEPRPLAPAPNGPAPEEPGPEEPGPEEPGPGPRPEEPGPGPTDPDDSPVVHERSVSLVEGSRKLKGTVTVEDGTTGCYANVLVRLQRRRDGRWQTIAKLVTDADGDFKKRVRGKRSRYRAVAPREAGPDDSICVKATSPAIWF